MILSLLAAAALLAPADSVPLYDNLGTHSHRVTASPQAQRYFDQGLRLVFGFNHGEAIRAFREAQRLDSNCAMCYWGEALAYGPHVNAGMDSAAGAAAYAALEQAQTHLPHASAPERAYIGALAKRYAEAPPANRAPLDSAYARAMGELVRRYPGDLDAATLYAEALMDLRPWNYWMPDGRPYPGTDQIVGQLERVIKANPNHPGACHYYIHAVEAVAPAKAVACAERLARLMPGAGHIVHMPAHIYIRVGRYADAIASNVHAVHTDETYIDGARPQGLYPMAYYPHNIHFLAFASTMSGQSAQALQAARTLVSKVPLDAAAKVPELEELLPYATLTAVTFGRWDDVLAAAPPPAALKYAMAMRSYARGVAFAATGRPDAARAALDSLQAVQATTAEGLRGNLEIARHVLLGEIAARAGQPAEAIPHFETAAKLEDAIRYIEPPRWYYPIRHSWGAALLKAGRAADAERVYREDLARFPENGWSLFGLAQALEAQGKADEAAAVRRRFDKAWAQADVTLVASRF